jgi:hypothetical protein
MPLQAVVIAFLVIALVAIVWRFMPRSTDGSMRLPTLLDESVGMWLIRRALGRAGADRQDADEVAWPEPAQDEIAYRIGVPGAPQPTLPTRVVVSSARSRVEPMGPSHVAPVLPQAATPATQRRRPSGALAAQRRTAGAVALAAVAIAVTIVALGTRQLGGEVLSATGTPAGSAGGGFVGGPADASPNGSSEPSSSVSP